MSRKICQLPDFDFSSLPESVQDILDRLRRKKISFWLVGGFVRDWVGGCPNHRDIDIGVKCNVYKLQSIIGGKVVRGHHPIVKTGGCDVVPVADLQADLELRDFTVNAMAIDADGALIDPFQGSCDAAGHVFRMTRPDIFLEDPVRLARLCRLAARMDWAIEPQTAAAAKRASTLIERRDLLKRNALRLGLEIIKSFDDPKPSKFFRLAHEYHVLPLLLPHLEQCFDSENKTHLETVLLHCDHAPMGQSGARMAALLMNLAPAGKPGRAKRSSGIARNFLAEICWDYATRRIFPEQCRWDAETIAMAIRLQRQDFSGQNVDWCSLLRCANGSFNLAKLCAIRSEGFGEQITPGKLLAMRSNILRKGLQEKAPPRQRMAALRFYGYSKKLANKIISGQIIPSF